MRHSNQIYPIERIISLLTYLSAGFIGFLWMIIAAISKKKLTPFILYHVMQSIFLSIAYYIVIELYKLIFIIIAKIPLLNTLIFIFNDIINGPISVLAGLSILQITASGIMLYLAITSFMGQYSYIPFVSNIINQGIGRD